MLHDINNPVLILISYDLVVNDLIYGILWKKVVNIELNQLIVSKIFDVVEKPLNVNIITLR